MKKCTGCGEKKVIFKHDFNFEGKKVPLNLCESCTKVLIVSLLDLVDYRYYRTALERFGSKMLT